jgi:tol-pal system protein YbgF
MRNWLVWFVLLWAPAGASLAGIFDREDAEARKQVADLRAEAQQQNRTVDDRLKRLEASIKSLGLVELASQIEQLNVEIGKLRGQIELQTNQIETTQKRQRELYIDLDSRLRAIEGGPSSSSKLETPAGGAGSSGSVATPPSPAPVAAAKAEEHKEVAKPAVAEPPKPMVEPKEAKEPVKASTPTVAAAKPAMPSKPVVPPVPPIVTNPPAVSPAPPPVVAPPAPTAAPAPAPSATASTATPPTATPPRPAAAPPSQEAGADIKAYEEAHRVFRSGDYSGAVNAFKTFTEQFPSSLLAPNAQYWIGISYYNLRDLKSAMASHQALMKRYPESPKVPDSMLNIATIQSDTGDNAAARTTLEDIVSKYPTSDAAVKARTRLTRR